LPADYVLPHGSTRPSFNENDPALAQARRIAHSEGMSQQGFEKLLGVFASTQIPGQAQQQTQLARLRETNMAQLGVTANLRVDAVANWMAARAGAEGRQVADFIRAYPSAAIVKAMENVIKQVSSQRAAAESQRRESESPNADAAKIPPHVDRTNYRAVRVWQMQQKYFGGQR
jgi:hypothetical protein